MEPLGLTATLSPLCRVMYNNIKQLYVQAVQTGRGQIPGTNIKSKDTFIKIFSTNRPKK